MARGTFAWCAPHSCSGSSSPAWRLERSPIEIALPALPLVTARVRWVCSSAWGTRLGGGCTSGHGVCGLSRLSIRSLVATLTFIATGALTVFVVQHVLKLGGAP